jgi:hypothetical protein
MLSETPPTSHLFRLQNPFQENTLLHVNYMKKVLKEISLHA